MEQSPSLHSPQEIEPWTRVGIYGGTFDPPHAGHVQVATDFVASGLVDELIVVPAFTNPLKPSPSAPFDARVAMCELAFAGLPRTTVLATKRSEFMCQVVADLFLEGRGHAQYYVLVGADVLGGLTRWRNVVDLFCFADVAAFARGGLDPVSERLKLPPYMRKRIHIAKGLSSLSLSSTEVRETLRSGSDAGDSLSPDVGVFCAITGLYSRP